MRGKRVLVVEDDPDLLALVRFIFVSAGAEVYTASNGLEGLRRFSECLPDLVLLDIDMPVLDGWETCRLIRSLSDVPIIFVTALTEQEDVVRGLDCGAVDYVGKPFSPKVLLARAEMALRSRDGGAQERRVLCENDQNWTETLTDPGAC